MKPSKALSRECGRRILRTRRNLGLTQVELSKRARVSQSAISKLENGQRVPYWPTLRKLCKALDINADELMVMQ